MQAQFIPSQSLNPLVFRVILGGCFFLFMPSATYFFSTAKKSRQKMPLSNAEGLAQREPFVGEHTKDGDLQSWMNNECPLRIGLARCV